MAVEPLTTRKGIISMNKKEVGVKTRRKFVMGAAAGTVAAASLMSGKTGAVEGAKRAPFGTKVHEMLDRESAKKLTSEARKLSKGQLLKIRQF